MIRPMFAFTLLIATGMPGFAQGDPIADRIMQRISESQNYFKQGDYQMGANRVNEACSMLRGRPNAIPGTTSENLATDALQFLEKKANAAKAAGDLRQRGRIIIAEQPILHALVSQDRQNARWHFMLGTTFIEQAGGPSINTAGDRASLQMAIREFDQAISCPGGEQYSAQANQMKADCMKEMQRRVAKGREIMNRGVREMMKYRGPVDSGGEKTSSWCSTCRHYHGPGECNYGSY